MSIHKRNNKLKASPFYIIMLPSTSIIITSFVIIAFVINNLYVLKEWHSQTEFTRAHVFTDTPIPATLFKYSPNIISSAPHLSQMPKTTPLPLGLTGVVASSDSKLSLAIIQGPLGQQSYREGEAILGVEAVRVEKIRPGSVQISNREEMQLLEMDIQQREKSDKTSVQASRMDTAHHLIHYLSFTPVYEKSQLIGYRVNPRIAPKKYVKLGLIKNEFVKKINGLLLDNKETADKLISSLEDLNDVQFTVVRKNQTQDIYINLATIEMSEGVSTDVRND